MENNKLISMTEKVLETYTRLCNGEITEEEGLMIPVRYAKFLKQPLEIGFFVATDEDGNVFMDYSEKPNREEYWDREQDVFNGELYNHNMNMHHKYLRAYNRVLFTGFVIMPDAACYNTVHDKNDLRFHIPDNTKMIIESICKKDLNLSETAIKQIYG